jgi:hypothetical protein
MTYGLVVDPVARAARDVDVDLSDFRSIEGAIGGRMFEAHPAELNGRKVGTVFMAENREALPTQESFAFDDLIVAGFAQARIYGPALFVPDAPHERSVDASHTFFGSDEAQELAPLEIRMMDKREVSRPRPWAENADLLLRHEPRGFMARKTGTFTSRRCSVAELEAAFLGFYEWARKDNTFRHDSPFGRSFLAPPFIFPDGLEPANDEELNASLAAERGDLDLPFPFDAFWIVRWDVWIGGDGGGEGPALLYVERQQEGFTTRDTFFDRRSGYNVCQTQHHDRLGQLPGALFYGLYRIEHRRHLVQRDVRTPELDRVNAGRARSKHGLEPLPPFTRITGNVDVGRSRLGTGFGSERCRHERREHWRKRRNGVELQPEEWVRVRRAVVRPDKRMSNPRRYLVV